MNGGSGANALRHQKLEKQRMLMEQRRRQRQMQAGMMTQTVVSDSRPLSSKVLRPTSQHSLNRRPFSAETSTAQQQYSSNELPPSQHPETAPRPPTYQPSCAPSIFSVSRSSNPPSYAPTYAPSLPSNDLLSSSPSAPPSHSHSDSHTPDDPGCATDTHTTLTDDIQPTEDDDNTLCEQPQDYEKPSSSGMAAKLSAMGLAESVDYNSDDDECTTEEEEEADQRESTDGEGLVDLPSGVPFSSADEESVTGRVAPTAPEKFPVETKERQSKHIDVGNLKDFVMKPAPEEVTVKCRVFRDKRGMDKTMYPTYTIHLEQEDTGEKVFLLAARKRKKSRSSNYLLSTDQTDLSRMGDNYVAKLRSNFLGTSFTVYDSGLNPSKRGAQRNSSGIREEMALIHYDTNVLGFKGPRKMQVVIPAMSHEKHRLAVKPKRVSETLLERWRNQYMTDLLEIHNKQPTWSEETQAYVLNFHGRVTQASVKNFQLVHSADENYIVVQFGRISEDVFTLDYKYPVCAVQAFAIALSSFDSKLACE